MTTSNEGKNASIQATPKEAILYELRYIDDMDNENPYLVIGIFPNEHLAEVALANWIVRNSEEVLFHPWKNPALGLDESIAESDDPMEEYLKRYSYEATLNYHFTNSADDYEIVPVEFASEVADLHTGSVASLSK